MGFGRGRALVNVQHLVFRGVGISNNDEAVQGRSEVDASQAVHRSSNDLLVICPQAGKPHTLRGRSVGALRTPLLYFEELFKGLEGTKL